MANQQWQFATFSADGDAESAGFLNEPARQGRGEASATLRNNGSAGVFYLEPGSLGSSQQPTWEFREFAAPNGEKEAVIFLNEPARQGRGEASVTLRNNGSAGVLYLAPGSLGTSTQQTWESRDFTGPDAEQQAADFLNEPARQGRGEASVTPRNNGSVGLVYLAPGTLGTSTRQTWYFKDFPGPDGVTSALAYLNASPRQGAGEVSGYARNDGSAVIFYLEPGSD
jgi:hypothetical protein